MTKPSRAYDGNRFATALAKAALARASGVKYWFCIPCLDVHLDSEVVCPNIRPGEKL